MFLALLLQSYLTTFAEGLAFVTSSDEHICVSLFDHLLIARMPRTMRWLKFMFSLVIYGLLVWVLWRMALGAWEDGRGTIVLALPLWLFSGLAAVLSTAGFVIYIVTARPQAAPAGSAP